MICKCFFVVSVVDPLVSSLVCSAVWDAEQARAALSDLGLGAVEKVDSRLRGKLVKGPTVSGEVGGGDRGGFQVEEGLEEG